MPNLTATLTITPEIRKQILELNEITFNIDPDVVRTIKASAVADFACTFDSIEEITGYWVHVKAKEFVEMIKPETRH